MRDRFRACQQRYQEHFEFLDGRVFEGFLPQVHAGFQGLEEALLL